MTTSWYPDLDDDEADARWRGGSFELDIRLPIEVTVPGFLRSLDIRVTGSCTPPYRRPRAAAERTRSRRRAAGSRRTKRYGLRPAGPSGRQVDWPFNTIRSVRG